MRFRLARVMPLVCLGLSGFFAATASAQPRSKKTPTEAGGDKSIEKQSAWEQRVMGEDGAKKADMKKIAAAQKLAEEARKNPPPEPAVHHKDPNKEGVRAKRESSIGLPIESEETEKAAVKKAPIAKKPAPSNSANDELGALVAASLASEKKGASSADSGGSTDETSSVGRGRGRRARGRGKVSTSAPKPNAAPSSLDHMFAGDK